MTSLAPTLALSGPLNRVDVSVTLSATPRAWHSLRTALGITEGLDCPLPASKIPGLVNTTRLFSSNPTPSNPHPLNTVTKQENPYSDPGTAQRVFYTQIVRGL